MIEPFSQEMLDKVLAEEEAMRQEIRSQYPKNRQGRRAAERAIKKAGLDTGGNDTRAGR